ncbi:MAG: RNA polymerase subunit sigma [Gemmataceae bacterium]|nr:RNA polymerase subunit sigma [Gemmataceae bacterium]
MGPNFLHQPPAAFAADSPGGLAAELYHDLHRLAVRQLEAQRPGHTLQPTALVNEAYVRLAGTPAFHGRTHFLSAAAAAMRHVLVDHARGRGRAKRGGGRRPVGLPIGGPACQSREVAMVDVLDALAALAALDPRQARLVELRVFGGLTVGAAAAELGIPLRTAEREWAMARAWLAVRFEERV